MTMTGNKQPDPKPSKPPKPLNPENPPDDENVENVEDDKFVLPKVGPGTLAEIIEEHDKREREKEK